MHFISLLTIITMIDLHMLLIVFPFIPPINYENHPSIPLSFYSESKWREDKYILCTNPKGKTQEATMSSEIYQAPVKYSFYLPPCYDENSNTRYPVIYLLHGQTYNNNQWVELGLDDAANKLINEKQISPMIIIMPNDPDWHQPGDSPFGRMLIEELIPYVDKIYPTRAERQFRAIGGLSRGASWAFHLGLTDWELFSKIGAHSLPVFVSDDNNIPGWLDAIPYQSIPQIYIDTGKQDSELSVARSIEVLLSSRQIPHEWHLFNGAHTGEYWSGHIEKYLLWYGNDWTVLI